MWCSRAVNRTCLSCRATSCTRARSVEARPRLCVRLAASLAVFPVVSRLPSTASADLQSLFGGFPGTTQLSDFPSACIPALRSLTFSGRSAGPSPTDIEGISRFPCEKFPHMLRVFDCAGTDMDSPLTPMSAWPSASMNGVGSPDKLISQLNGWPVCAPVNASPPALRPSVHDSGSR